MTLSAKHGRALLNGSEQRVIYSEAIGVDHVERRIAARLGIPQTSYPQMIAELMNDCHGMAVAGTHGKSTTTAMIATIMTHAGLDPTVICGACRLERHPEGRQGAGEWLVAEACEYRENFRHLRPRLPCCWTSSWIISTITSRRPARGGIPQICRTATHRWHAGSQCRL